MKESAIEDTPLFNQSLAKALSVIRAFSSRQRTMTLAEIAIVAQITRSSAQRIVFTLEALGYIRKHPQTRRFLLTPRALSIGCNYLEADPLVDCANPFLAALNAQCKESVALTEPDGLDMVYVSRFPSHEHVTIHVPVGKRVPMYCTGSGRAYLSARNDQESMEILKQSERKKYTPTTITDIGEILNMLEEAKARGYAYNNEELYIGDVTIASPIVNASGEAIAAVHVAAPGSRWTFAEASQKLAPLVLECARSISNAARNFD
ncbi:IclR family transcriptional regulator [Paraburkholderia unamae]|uniref:IclR family transcriptional regulator n=1 Tax=Paraburkholderia unamae TaxID=219649 RepID=UPI001CC745A9|nr:IclR family transcriptional regulator [Paraburkholderia unamae]